MRRGSWPTCAASGVRYVALATGDVETTAEAVGLAAGVDRIYARQSPQDKLELVRALARPRRT